MATQIPSGACMAIYVVSHTASVRPYTFRMGHEFDETKTTVDNANELFDAYRDTVHGPRAHTAYSLSRVDVIRNSGGTLLIGSSTLAASAGTRSNDLPVSSTSAILTKRTSGFGRSMRGRAYLPGCIAEVEVNEVGTLTASWVTAQQTAYDAWLLRLQTIQSGFAEALSPLLFHSNASSAGFEPGGSAENITAFLARSYQGTQRRRLAVG